MIYTVVYGGGRKMFRLWDRLWFALRTGVRK